MVAGGKLVPKQRTTLGQQGQKADLCLGLLGLKRLVYFQVEKSSEQLHACLLEPWGRDALLRLIGC